jgi:hypothetical protein
VLVQYPEHLVGVGHQVGGELQPYHHVNRHAANLAQVEQAAGGHVRQDALGGVPLERDGDNLSLVPLGAQGIAQPLGVKLGPAADEGYLGGCNQDMHGWTSDDGRWTMDDGRWATSGLLSCLICV